MDQAIRNRLRGVVTQCRRLLEDSVSQELEGKFSIYVEKGVVNADRHAKMSVLNEEGRAARNDILDHYEHIKARGFRPTEALDQLVREIAFTHLNRLCAYKMMEAREVYVKGQKFREAVSRGLNSNGVKFYLAEHPDDERRFSTGQQEIAYRHFLNWLGGQLSEEIGVLFNPNDPANRLYPRQKTLDDVLSLLNDQELAGIWSQDETIGWVYQYFTPKELRDQARKESQVPRNSYELAFRNQFFTPRYVVEFLSDNTLGRTWYEMRQGRTQLADQCRYLVRQPDEIFFARATSPDQEFSADAVIEASRLLREGDEQSFPPFDTTNESIQRMIEIAQTVSAYDRFGHEVFKNWNADEGPRLAERLYELSTQEILDWMFMTCRADRHGGRGEVYVTPWFLALANEVRRRALEARKSDLNSEERLRLPVFIPYRPKKDPREIKILDPACGSGHFLLYCFDLLLVIYIEAYADPEIGPLLQKDYPTLDELKKAVPGLILKHNLHGIDIDLRCSQIAALALWLRCQRAYKETGLKKDRPRITRSNIVCAEPMPGEKELLDEFLKTLRDDHLEALIRQVMQVPEGTRVRATKAMADSLSDLVRTVWEKMQLAGEAGSLLKIEEELQDAICKGRDEWEERLPLFRFTEYGLSEQPKERLVRFVPGDVEGERSTFWDRAESLVRMALDEFVTFASHGGRLKRQLFVEDAKQGLGFVDLCRHRYDAVLMNPPFGLAQKHLNRMLASFYPDTYVDLYGCFVTRGLELAESGILGAITSRAFLMTKKLARWRENELIDSVDLMLDLGSPVMDDAFVEACAFTASRSSSATSLLAFDRRFSSEKGQPLVSPSGEFPKERGYCIDKPRLHLLPQAKMLYSLPGPIYSLLRSPEAFEPEIGTAREGMRTFDDFRFLRLRWEVSPSNIGRNFDWEPLSKGGEYAIYYSDIHLLVKWGKDGKELAESNYRVNGQTAQSRQASEFWRRPGGTYSKRSVKGFSVRALPADCIFGTKGPAVLSESAVPPSAIIGWLNSRLIRSLVHIQANAFEFNTGIIKRLPWKSNEKILGLSGETTKAIEACRDAAALSEVNSWFVGPIVGQTLASASIMAQEKRKSAETIRLDTCLEWDRTVDEVYEVDSTSLLVESDDECEADEDDQSDGEQPSPSHEAHPLLSYAMGSVLGRWDIRYATGEAAPPRIPDPFAPLPACPPGMLQGSDSLPATQVPGGYLLRIDWDGILVDDPDHPDDIIRRVRDVLEVIWNERANAIEKEACEILGAPNLREYFRKPGAGGFWVDHIKRYSKSRRRAPIYWLLQSSKKNYALWIYYHRLDKDILFKALLNYVEPKIRLEVGRLDSLRSQKQALGEGGKGSKKFDKEIEKEEDFLAELRDFAERLGRAARLEFGDKEKLDSSVTYDPDLNDGVVLNIAPLHELVPWKEAKAYWDDLMKGEYEWSTMGKKLRQKRLVK